MSVETKLSEMSDSGQFEKLATSILRRADSTYASAIQTGVNPEGKPIADPVDALGLVDGSEPPHYIIFEYTTAQRSDLHAKWLADPAPDSSTNEGDLVKAARIADEIRADEPDAKFTVVLVSNRSPESETLTAVYEVARDRELAVDPWGVHELSDFLNNDPDGQYLRRKHFGIDAERLSEPLLLELSEKSMEAYQESFHIGVEETRVERPELDTILRNARSSESGSYLIPIVGNSGFGKTITCYQAMNHWCKADEPTLRLEPSDIGEVNSLSRAIQSSLERLHPSLYASAGQDALQIARDNKRLLLVVDDLSRASNPSRLFSRLLNWMGGAKDGNTPDTGGLGVTILVPLWPRIWAKQERDIDYNKFSSPVELGAFSTELAVQLIQSHAETHSEDIDEEKAQRLADQIGRDPHLIGLLGVLLGREEGLEDLPSTSKEVIREFVHYSFETASEASEAGLMLPDLRIAVEKLSLNILKHRDLEPLWRTVKDWSDACSNNLEEIRCLTAQAQLLFLSEGHSDSYLSYRHDRIRDFLLSQHALEQVDSGKDLPEYLGDPYYYSVLGKGIAYFQPNPDILSCLVEQNPLALLEALKELSGEGTAYEEELGTEFLDWLESQGGHAELPNSLLGEAMDILFETRSDEVLRITESLPQYPQVQLARFRNGDLNAGIQFCNIESSGSPNTNFSQRDSVFEETKSKLGDRYAEMLSEVLSTVKSEHVLGALRLAGYLGRTELQSGLEDCWEQHNDNTQLLPAFLWATFQCCIPENPSLTDQIIAQWSSLPEGSSIDDSSVEFGQGDVYSDVKFSLTRNMSDDQIRYLIEAVEAFPDIEYFLLRLLNKAPDPDALELIVRKIGEHRRESDGHSFWGTGLLDPWSPETHRGQVLPPEAKERMKTIWSDDTNIDETRKSAFNLWARSTQEADIDVLKSAGEEDLFSYSASYHRLKVGDETILRSSSLDFVENPRLLSVLPDAWCTEAYDVVDEIIDQTPLDDQPDLVHHLGEILFLIPQNDAEKLLTTHWKKVNDIPSFFQAALFTATEQTRELAHEAYENSGNPPGLFQHLGMNFGFKTYCRSELITKDHLYSLEPYLHEVDEMALIDIGEKAKDIGLDDWGVDHVQPLLPGDKRQLVFPTEADIRQELNEVKENEDIGREILGWMLRYERRVESTERIFPVLEDWLRENETVDGFLIATEIVKKWGTRSDLEILENTSLTEEQTQELYENAKFAVKVRSLS